jgi:hypothetical protein
VASSTKTTPPPPPEQDSGERPTVIPSYSPEAFARDSETRQRTVPGEATIEEARRLHAEGKHEDALFSLAKLLDAAPFHSEATTLAEACREGLEHDCLAELGSMSALFVPAMSPNELKQVGLDSVSAFLISLLDGNTDVENVLDMCGLPRLLALRHLRGLLRRGAITAR